MCWVTYLKTTVYTNAAETPMHAFKAPNGSIYFQNFY